MARKSVPKLTETEVLEASRRRCCLCVFLQDRDEVRKGQIAHLNHDPSDTEFENLVWLCLEHHDEYDSSTSQSKGLTSEEIRRYRDRLYRRYAFVPANAGAVGNSARRARIVTLPPSNECERLRKRFRKELSFIDQPWRFPLWQVANEPELFAFKAGNRADGVCLIERIDLPDGRIVVACMQIGGNPGNSITNCVEELCFQVCERFDIPAHRLVWLEHYDYGGRGDWDRVTFTKQPPDSLFEDPKWTEMTPEMWSDLRLKPKKKLLRVHGDFASKLRKFFVWP